MIFKYCCILLFLGLVFLVDDDGTTAATDDGNMVNPNTAIQSNNTCDPVSGRIVSKQREQNCDSVTVACNMECIVVLVVLVLGLLLLLFVLVVVSL